MANPKQAARSYRIQQLHGMSPKERLLLTYDIAIAAANEGDAERLCRLLAVLRAALDYEAGLGLGISLHRIYKYCESAVREREAYHEAAQLLHTLRQSFEMAEPRRGRE